MTKTQNSKKIAVRFFAICMAILLVVSIGIWGLQTSWGQVKIDRFYLAGNNGETISGLTYVPANATDETPAPVIVLFHGRSNATHSNDTWSMELARRGYVVVSPDLAGGGESAVTSRDAQATIVTQYANTLSFVDHDYGVNLLGYSAGTGTGLAVYDALSEQININSMCQVFGPFLQFVSGGFSHVDTNFCLVKFTADQYDGDFLGDPQVCLEWVAEQAGIPDLEINKDYDRNGKVFRYAQIDGTLHQTGNISSATITEIVSFFTSVVPAPIELDNANLVWIPQQLLSGVAAVTMMFALAAFLNLMMQLDFFAVIANAVPVKEPRRGAKAWVMDILFSIVIPAILFVPVSAYAMRFAGEIPGFQKIFTSNNLNGIMAWLMVLAIIGLVRLFLARNKRKKAGIQDSLATYALGAEGETKVKWGNVGRAFIMGIATIIFFCTWMWLLEEFAGINYQVWSLATYLKPSGMRLIRAIPYVIVIFIAMFCGNLTQRVLPSTGNERRDMWIAVAVNSVLTAGALAILLIIQYGGSMIIGTGYAPIPQIDIYGTGVNKSCGALDFAFGYCYMMGGTTGVVTYMYRKYGNIWCAAIPCAIFCGVFTLASFTLVA